MPTRPFLLHRRLWRPLPSTALATLVAALALTPRLGHHLLTEWDEGIYAEVAREMLSSRWLTPHWNGALFLEKPPLFFWLTALLFKLFGVTEFWARAPSALAGVGVVGLLHAWLARRHGSLTAWLSTGILLGTFGFLHACHVGELDVLLTLGCCLALAGLAQVQAGAQAGGHHGWLLFWAGFALACMTKSFAAVTLPLTALTLALFEGWSWTCLNRRFLLGGGLFLLLVLPWHLAMLALHHAEFIDQYIGHSLLTRSTQQMDEHITSWWFYLKVLLVAAPPFVVLYAPALLRALRPAHRELRPWALFVLVTLAVFSVTRTRLPHYIVPIYPALSLVAAVYVADLLRGYQAHNLSRSSRLLASAVLLVLGGVSVWLTAPARKALHTERRENGQALLSNTQSIPLLKQLAGHPEWTPGPLLLWRDGRIVSTATVVFYSTRSTQLVQLAGSIHPAPDDWTFHAIPLGAAITLTPRLLLADRTLLPSLPAAYTFTPIASSPTQILGTLVRTR